MADEKPIWQRLDGETDKAFEAFCHYRDLGADRSIDKAYQQHQNSTKTAPRYWGDWSTGNDWVKRAAAYDEWVANEHSRERIKRQKKVEANAWKDYEAIRKGIEKRVAIYDSQNWKAEPHELGGLLALMKSADDLARRAVGLADRISESKTDVTSNGKTVPIAIVRMDLDEL